MNKEILLIILVRERHECIANDKLDFHIKNETRQKLRTTLDGECLRVVHQNLNTPFVLTHADINQVDTVA